MSQASEQPSARTSARRRLIRGAFAAPAALTLYSGSAFATASNTRCIVNQVNYPQLPPASGYTDTWVRVQLWTVGADANLSTWVCGADIAALLKPKMPVPFLSSSQWQCFSAGSGSGYSAGQIITQTPTKGSAVATRNGSYVAVRIDGTGKIIGVVGLNGTSGSAVAGTCWASFGAAMV